MDGHFNGIGQFIVVGSQEVLKTFEGLVERLEAIGIKKGEFSKNEKLDDVYNTLFLKMFPQQNYSEVILTLNCCTNCMQRMVKFCVQFASDTVN